MLRKRLAVFCLAFSVLMAVPMLPGCSTPVSIVTPEGKAAYTANEVLVRVERLQDAAIAAHTNGSLNTDTARAIVFVTVNVFEIADAATHGWHATARQAWMQAKADIPALQSGGQFYVLAAAVDEALGGSR